MVFRFSSICGVGLTGVHIWLLLLPMILVPLTATAQTRLFQPGDSGVTATLDFMMINENYHGNTFGVLRGAYTHNGLWDLGVEYGNTDFNNGDGGFAFFGNFTLINPGPEDRWGLEAGVRYSDQYSETNFPYMPGYFIPEYSKVRYRNIIPGLRGFYRNSKSTQVLGFGGFYRFRKHEVLAPDDDVLIGHDYDELGFDFDVHERIWGGMFLSVKVEYVQNKTGSSDRWELATIFSFGVLFGRDSNDGGDSDE